MQDFANYRASQDLEASRAYSTTCSPDIPSLIFRILPGISASLIGLKIAQIKASQAAFIEAPMIVEEVVEMPLEFGFYEALRNYAAFPRD